MDNSMSAKEQAAKVELWMTIASKRIDAKVLRFDEREIEVRPVEWLAEQIADAYAEASSLPSAPPVQSLRAHILKMMEIREWATHWIHRSAYLHLESAELAEAVRGKRGDTLDESADVLITLLALSPHELVDIIEAAWKKVDELMTKPRYAGEAGTFGDAKVLPAPPQEETR